MMQADFQRVLSSRMATLLKETPKQERAAAMAAVVSRLYQADLLNRQPQSQDPVQFSLELFQSTKLLEPDQMKLQSIKGAESPEDMVERLLPSDHHMD